MKSSLYFAAIFCLGLGLTGCGDSLTSPANEIDYQDEASASKVLERDSYRMPVDFGDSFGDTDESDSTKTTSTIGPIDLGGKK